MRTSILISLTLAVCLAGVAWAGPTLLKKAGVDPFPGNIITKLKVWVDPDTECQYFVTDDQPFNRAQGFSPTGITPRLLPSGLPMCGPDQPRL